MSALYIQKEGRQWGPFTTEELEGQVAAGAFSREDLYWTEGMENWLPLSQIVETVPDESGIPTAEETPPEDTVYFDEEGIRVTLNEISWNDEMLEPVLVAKSSATIEKVRRVKPVITAIVLGVAAIIVALLEIPKTTTTHWALWAGLLVVLIFGLLRSLYSGLRAARSMVVLDMVDGTEYIIRAGPNIAKRLNDAIVQAREDAQQQVAES